MCIDACRSPTHPLSVVSASSERHSSTQPGQDKHSITFTIYIFANNCVHSVGQLNSRLIQENAIICACCSAGPFEFRRFIVASCCFAIFLHLQINCLSFMYILCPVSYAARMAREICLLNAFC